MYIIVIFIGLFSRSCFFLLVFGVGEMLEDLLYDKELNCCLRFLRLIFLGEKKGICKGILILVGV